MREPTMLRPAGFGLAWAFVFAAAAYDGYFAWCHQEALQSWELNPLARWAALGFGIGGLLAFKYAGLAFAASIAAYCVRHHSRLATPLTVCVVALYALLSLHYLVSAWEPEVCLPDFLAAGRLADGGPLLGR